MIGLVGLILIQLSWHKKMIVGYCQQETHESSSEKKKAQIV